MNDYENQISDKQKFTKPEIILYLIKNTQL